MKIKRTIFLVLVSLVLCGLSALGQMAGDSKQFNKDGLTFDYPSSWLLQDSSNADAQQMTVGKAGQDFQITVFVFRTPVTSPERIAEAKKVLVDTYVNSTAKQFEQMGAKPERLPVSSEIAGVPSEGIKVQAEMDSETGAAEIFWGVVGQRLVVLTFFGPDKVRKQMLAGWDTIRTSLKVAEPDVAKPTPSPK